MSHAVLFSAFAVVVLGVLVLAALLWPARRGARWAPTAALAVATATLVGAYAGGATLLGRPKPARLNITAGEAADVQLAGAHYVEGRAIYLWLLRPGDPAPRAYSLPWSRETAEALQAARGEAEANGTEVRVRGHLGPRSQSGGIEFYAPPPPPMPAKRSG